MSRMTFDRWVPLCTVTIQTKRPLKLHTFTAEPASETFFGNRATVVCVFAAEVDSATFNGTVWLNVKRYGASVDPTNWKVLMLLTGIWATREHEQPKTLQRSNRFPQKLLVTICSPFSTKCHAERSGLCIVVGFLHAENYDNIQHETRPREIRFGLFTRQRLRNLNVAPGSNISEKNQIQASVWAKPSNLKVKNMALIKKQYAFKKQEQNRFVNIIIVVIETKIKVNNQSRPT